MVDLIGAPVTDPSTGQLLARAEAAYRYAVADPAAAAPVASAVVDDARRSGALEPLVVGLRAQAWSALRLLAGEQAKTLLDEAARLARRDTRSGRLGEVLMSRAAVNHELGRSRAARRDLDHARELLGARVPPELEFQHAVQHQNAGRLGAAAAIYRRVLSQGGPPDIRAKTANNLGLIEAQFGHYGPALVLVRRARELASEVGPAYTAFFAESHALVTANAGRLPASMELFEQAQRLYERAGLPIAELLFDHAYVLSDLRLLPEAADAATRAADEFAATGAVLMRAEAELQVARLALLVGDLAAASDAAASAEWTLRQQRRAGWAAIAVAIGSAARATAGNASVADLRRVRRAAATLERLQMTSSAIDAHLSAAQIAQQHRRPAWAVSSLDRASELARGGPVLVRLKGRLAAALAAGLRADDRGLVQHCRSGLGDLDRHRAVLASTELRVLASAHGTELGTIGLRALVRSGSASEVFRWMERTRAAALLVVQRTAVDGLEELAALRALQTEIDTTGGESPALVARHAALESRVRRMSWATTTSAAAATRPPTGAELRGSLGERVLVEYGVLDGDMLAAIVTPRRVSLVRLGPVAPIEQEIEGLYFALRLLARRASAGTAPSLRHVVEQRLQRLRAALVDALRLPDPTVELVIVPAGPLQRAPWSALHDGPVAVSPSAAFWLRARGRAAPIDQSVALVAGPGLASATDEVQHLGSLHQDRVVLVPPLSTVNRVAEALKSASLAHLACHGQVRSDNPLFSGLMLSDGSLSVQELELRDIAPHRIILAACEAAADVSYAGGETLGFVSALLARGTAGMVASLILVPDAAAVSLMVALHEQVRAGRTLVGALHAARSAMDRDDSHELVNWCGFTAYGAA